MKQNDINFNGNFNNLNKNNNKEKNTEKNNNEKNNINKWKNKTQNNSQKNITHANKRIKLKLIKSMKVLPISIAGIYFFKNGNYLVLGREKYDKLFEYLGDSGTIEYKIFDKKMQIIKSSKKDLKISIRNVKVVDEENIICLLNTYELINLNIQNGKIKKLFNFNETIYNLLYYKDKLITCNHELKEGIKIWEKIKSPISTNNKHHYQIMNKLFYPKIYGSDNITYTTMYLLENKNLLITSNDEESVCIWNLKKLKFDHIFILDWCPYIFSNYKNNLVIFGSGIYEGYKTPNELVLYDVKEKKINNTIKLDFIMLDVRYIKKIDSIVISGGTDILRNDIYVYDSNLNKVQFFRKAHYRDINGFAFYEKDEKEDLLMSYSQDGAINIYSLI